MLDTGVNRVTLMGGGRDAIADDAATEGAVEGSTRRAEGRGASESDRSAVRVRSAPSVSRIEERRRASPHHRDPRLTRDIPSFRCIFDFSMNTSRRSCDM